MTQKEKEALLQEAKRRYPTGTTYMALNTGKVYKILNNSNIKIGNNGIIHEYNDKGEVLFSNEYYHLIYNPSIGWAEIVSTPQPQLKKGSWYRSSLWCNSFTVRKFEGLERGKFSYQEVLEEGTEYQKRNSINITETDDQRWETFTEVPLSEIQQYLPEAHPDKFAASTEEEWEPKVGEIWVYKSTDKWEILSINRVFCSIRDINTGYINDRYELSILKEKAYWRKALPHEIPGNEQPVPITGNSKGVFPQTSTPLKIETDQLNFKREEPEFKPVVSVTQELYRRKKTILFNN